MSQIQKPLSFLAINSESYFQTQVLEELGQRGHSVNRTTSKDYDCCQLILCDAAIIYLPPFNEREKIEDFLEEQKGCRINAIGLTQSHKERRLYQQQFPMMHFESLMDVVIPRCSSVIAECIEKRLEQH